MPLTHRMWKSFHKTEKKITQRLSSLKKQNQATYVLVMLISMSPEPNFSRLPLVNLIIKMSLNNTYDCLFLKNLAKVYSGIRHFDAGMRPSLLSISRTFS